MQCCRQWKEMTYWFMIQNRQTQLRDATCVRPHGTNVYFYVIAVIGNSVHSRIGGMEMGATVKGMEFIFMLGNFVKSSSCELMNSRLTAVVSQWDWARPFACGRQLCSLVYLRAPDSRARIYPLGLSYLVGVCSLWWDTMISLSAAGRGLVLPQLNGPGFIDSS